MSLADEMWALIPAVYRRRDDESGGALRAMVAILGEQAQVIQDDIAGLYDNWFIETCDDWLAPYIGDLIGVLDASPRGEPASAPDRRRLAAIAPSRMLVANTLRWRRRKGSFGLLGRLAWDVARWPSTAVEFGARLAANEDARFPRERLGWADIHRPVPLSGLGGPEDPLAHTVDVRAADAPRSPGRHGPRNVGVFVFRGTVLPVEHADAASIDDEGSGRFTFDPLGREIPLYAPSQGVSLAGKPPPIAISRERLGHRRADDDPAGPGWEIDRALYGREGAIMIWEKSEDDDRFRPVDAERIVPANLYRWRDRPPPDAVAVDPELGRIAFPARTAPQRVRVAYAYATPGGVGAPALDLPDDFSTFDKVHLVAASREEAHHELRTALEAWRKEPAASTLIEIQDSGTYDEDRLLIDFSKAARKLVIRAAPGCRPIIRLADRDAGMMDAWRVRGGREGALGPAGSSLTLQGLTIAERGVVIESFSGDFKLESCTLIPGWSLGPNGGRRRHDAPSLAFENASGPVTLLRSILGPVFIRADEHELAPLRITACDCILDAGDDHPALIAADGVPYADLTLRRVTVLGSLSVHSVALAENSLFAGGLDVARRQMGCVRFCFLPPGSRAPRQFACLPGSEDHPELAPAFVSRVFGAPGYAELAGDPQGRFQRGADDQGELGAYHDLFWTLRDGNLRAALAEYSPAGADVSVIYLS